MNIVRAASAARLEGRVFVLSVVISGVVQVVLNEIGPWVLHDRFRHFALANADRVCRVRRLNLLSICGLVLWIHQLLWRYGN